MEIKTQEILDIVRVTRKLSLPHFGNIDVKAYKSNNATDAVTEIDQQVEKFLETELAKVMPEVTFVGEEFGGDRESSAFWLVDPIDGTGHYIRGIPFCTTMLALIYNKQVIFSVIYDFVNDVIYHAELGKGAFKNGTRITVSTRPLGKSYLSIEINSQKEENEILVSEIRKRSNVINLLCAGYDFLLVAEGKTEGRITYDAFGKDYDFAPGSLLVSEAGGIVRNFKSETFDFTNLNFIAAAPQIYESLIKSNDSIEALMG
jgi:fructose-1,6-bisphosphatase/inositol monophosphatase family enzyme